MKNLNVSLLFCKSSPIDFSARQRRQLKRFHSFLKFKFKITMLNIYVQTISTLALKICTIVTNTL